MKTDNTRCRCIIDPNTEIDHNCDLNLCSSIDHYRKGCRCSTENLIHSPNDCKYCNSPKETDIHSEEWEKEFDQFWTRPPKHVPHGHQRWYVSPLRVKRFIRRTLQSQIQLAVKKERERVVRQIVEDEGGTEADVKHYLKFFELKDSLQSNTNTKKGNIE